MINQIKIELFKIRKRPLFILFLCMPIVVVVYDILFNAVLIASIDDLRDIYGTPTYNTTFIHHLLHRITLFSFLIFIFTCYDYFRIETRNNCYNMLFTLPQKKRTLYRAKVFSLLLVTVLYVIEVYIVLQLAALYFKVSNAPILVPCLLLCASLFLIALFQFFLAHSFRLFVVYMCIFIGLFGMLFLYHGSYKIFNPYYYIYFPYIFIRSKIADLELFYLLPVYIGLFYSLGFIAFRKLAYGKKNKD